MTSAETRGSSAREKAVHDLKCHPPYFQALLDGTKTFEVRRDDRGGYVEGDDLLIREWSPFPLTGTGDYTGREAWFWVRYVLPGGSFGIEPGFVVMSVQRALCLAVRDERTSGCRERRGHGDAHRTAYGDYWYDECDPDPASYHHRGPWEHVKGSDSLSRCAGCGYVSGK